MKATTISNPSIHDVIFEKGQRAQKHPGNVHYRKVIMDKASDYNLADTRDEKDMIAHWALQQVRGNFLTRNQDGKYCIINKDTAIAKIKQALRDRRKEPKTSAKASPSTKTKENNTPDVKRAKTTSELKTARTVPKNANRVSSSSKINRSDVKRLLEVCMDLEP